MKNKVFEKFTIKDIVFLAIMAAVMVLSTAIMPLVKELTKVIYGIAQLVTCFQLSLFTSIAIMKIRKVFSLTIILVFMSVIMIAMSRVMALSHITVAFIVELIVIVGFRGYKTNFSCFIAATLLPIAGLIVPTIWTAVTAPEAFAKTVENGYIVFGIIAAIAGLSALGSFLGILISKELQKAGLIKKDKNCESYISEDNYIDEKAETVFDNKEE